MQWYAAHIVILLEPLEKIEQPITAWEDIVLFSASSRQDAHQRATEYGKAKEAIDDGLMVYGRPARYRFLGVRKVVDCVDNDRQPEDGTEVSYLELEFSSARVAEQYVVDEKLPLDPGGGS